MSWVRKQKLPATETLQHNRHSCIELENLWLALHQTFNFVQNHQVNTNLLNKIPTRSTLT